MAPLRKALGLLILMSLSFVGLSLGATTLSQEEVKTMIKNAIETANKDAEKKMAIYMTRKCIAVLLRGNYEQKNHMIAKKICSPPDPDAFIPDGQTYLALEDYKGSHYAIGTEKKNWADAREACKKIKGDLVAMESTGETDHIHIELKNNLKINCTDVGSVAWIGGEGKGKQGDWKWVTGVTMPCPSGSRTVPIPNCPEFRLDSRMNLVKNENDHWHTSMDWSSNYIVGHEPDETGGKIVCLSAFLPSCYYAISTWSDEPCTTEYPYICEY